MNILLLEDEKKINDMLSLYLRQDGHTVESCTRAEEALDAFKADVFQVVISDLMLSGMQGEAFIKKIRENSDVYIVVLTAKTARESKLSLLDEGVDDYIGKPFSMKEVQLKLRNIEKRLERQGTMRFSFEGNTYTLKTPSNIIMKDDETIEFNSTQACIARVLMDHAMQTLSREQIIAHCLSESEAFDRIVDTYIKDLRKKFENKSIIETVYGAGYRFRGVRYD